MIPANPSQTASLYSQGKGRRRQPALKSKKWASHFVRGPNNFHRIITDEVLCFNESNIKETNLNLTKIKELKQGFIYNPFFYKDNINSFNDLNNYPLILQKEESNSRKLLDYIALNNNIKLIPKMEVVSQELIIEFVNIGLGIGFTIIDLAKRNYNNLEELKINKKIPNINVYLATNKSILPTFASKTFIKYLNRC